MSECDYNQLNCLRQIWRTLEQIRSQRDSTATSGIWVYLIPVYIFVAVFLILSVYAVIMYRSKSKQDLVLFDRRHRRSARLRFERRDNHELVDFLRSAVDDDENILDV